MKASSAEAEGDGESVEGGRWLCRPLDGEGPGAHWRLAGPGSAHRGGRPEEPPLSVWQETLPPCWIPGGDPSVGEETVARSFQA